MRLLLVFLKEPIDGKVKTRLAAEVGEQEATRRYRALVEVLLRQLQGLQNCRIRFCFTPDDADDSVRFWLLPQMEARQSAEEGLFHARPYEGKSKQEIDFRAQGDGHLGQRMERAFHQGFADGFSEIAAIGSDCPACGARWINAAFSRLGSADDRDLVIGPCPDGGYYLIAMKSLTPRLFQNITWSSASVFSETMVAAEEARLKTERLPELADVDSHDDWNQLMQTPLAAAVKKAMGETLDDHLSGLTDPRGSSAD